MAYNPFDDVIDQDPAYAVRDIPLGQTPTETGFQPVGEVIQQPISNPFDPFMNFAGDVIAQTVGRIAENLYDPVAAERGQKKFAIQQDAAKMFGKVPGQLTRDDKRFYEQRTGNKVEQLDFVEGFNSPIEYILADAVKGSQLIQDKEARFTELPGNLQLGIAFVPFEFWLGGFGGRRAVQEFGGEILNKYRGMSLGEIVTNPKAREEIPEVVASIEREYPVLRKQTGPRETTERPSDMDLVASQSDALDDRSLRFKSGQPSSTRTSGLGTFKVIEDYLKTTTEPKTMGEIAEATGLKRTQVEAFKKEKRNLPDYENKFKLSRKQGTTSFLLDYFKDPKATLQSPSALVGEGIGRREIANFLDNFPEYRSRVLMGSDDVNIQNKFSQGIEKLKSFDGETLSPREITNLFGYANTDDFAKVLNNPKLIDRGIITQDQVDYINSFRSPLSRKKLDSDAKIEKVAQEMAANPELQNLGVVETSRRFNVPQPTLSKEMRDNPELFGLITKEPKTTLSEDVLDIALVRKIIDKKIDDVDYAMINNLYRGTKVKSGLTPEQFLTQFKKQNPKFGKTRYDKNTKKAYQKLEDERLELQKEALAYFNNKLKDPRYSKYLKKSDEKQFQFHKAHAFEISDVTEQDRFTNMAQMSDLIFNAPAGSNLRLQQRFDRPARVIADLTDKDSLKALENTSVNTSASEIDRRFRLNIPSIIERLKEYGIEVYPENYRNLRDLIFGKKGIKEGIENAYENQGLGTLVPQGKKKGDVALVGVNPKGVSGKKRLQLLKKRFDKILEDQVLYEKSNGKFGKPIMRQGGEGTEGGFIGGLQGGGEVKPVRMAIGGDPLQNINQQQFAPDPAIDDDFFQEAVDSGNLQAGLMSLFKVFGKPKSVATPSNVKKVEQARDPLPQAMPGEQQVAPLQAGKQDFYFKSFFLDQLNDPNAPKADYPQGWMNFLVKGKKVPNAEMLDTGITQYLEDTAQFFPNKKITREDLEAIYDSSPLGNLEVRVKNDAGRVNTVDDIPAGEDAVNFNRFTNDQGKAQHKNAGSLNIDQQAEDYFEVVINAPNLPGQEKAFIRSSHFEEPNTIGFTRVGTYKNADNEKVAVIQEMQTDMLTEVRKEQERLFSFVKNLKRKRERLAAEVERDPEDLYYKNRLREFDNAYPPGVLEGLEADNLIKPFPNVVAKELIPEKTKSLDAIQKQINELAMANVEQYTDPAYKTKVFDLAQDQKTIVDQLMSMNRSANYDEKMRNIKVPSSGDTDELRRIAERDAELPNYNMKDLETFPPIPFNKQADYVDLLIKATIKAAKEKGINKVAIMPADIGANARWGKREGDAKKKFQNLYDKVGVQQLKNIAKKYDGVFGEEAIIDSSKAEKGLKFFNKGVDGEFQLLKDFAPTNRRVDEFLDEEIARVVNDYGPNEVVLKKEIAPGQTMEYYVKMSEDEGTLLDLTPLGDADRAENATIIIEETNPQKVKMYTITFDPSKLEEPMYMFKKKDGGTIAKDSLVSITDIYGEYGR